MLYQSARILRRDPFAVLRRLSSEVTQDTPAFPAINFWHSEDSAAITAELPGIQAEDVDISVKDNLVALKGERKPLDIDQKAVWRRRERAFGKFSRAVRIPFNVDPEKTKASMVNGVLQILLHRRDEDKPRRIEVKVS